MNKLPKNLKIKLPYSICPTILMSVTDGTAHYKLVVDGFTGEEIYYYNEKGQVHRDGDKPAVIEPHDIKEWYQNGKRHRDGGKPARIRRGGRKEYWLNGKNQDILPAIEKKLQESEKDLAEARHVVTVNKRKLAEAKKKQEADNG